MRELLARIKDELFQRRKRRRTMNVDNLETGLRVTVIRKLLSAINEVENLAKHSARYGPKGGGGISPKLRWYQLMGSLVQVLDAVLRNEDMERFEVKLGEMERTIEELARISGQTR